MSDPSSHGKPARRIAVNVAKLPELVRPQSDSGTARG